MSRASAADDTPEDKPRKGAKPRLVSSEAAPATPARKKPGNIVVFAGGATAWELVEAVHRGVKPAALRDLTDWFEESERTIAEHVNIKWTTLARRKAQGVLEKEESERVLRLARLASFAQEVFDGNRDIALRWLKMPAPALKGRIPLELAATEFGAEEVHKLLIRIEHGVYS